LNFIVAADLQHDILYKSIIKVDKMEEQSVMILIKLSLAILFNDLMQKKI